MPREEAVKHCMNTENQAFLTVADKVRALLRLPRLEAWPGQR